MKNIVIITTRYSVMEFGVGGFPFDCRVDIAQEYAEQVTVIL